MEKSVFDVLPELEKQISAGAQHITRIMEVRCIPGDYKRFGGEYENILGMMRSELLNSSALDGKEKDELLEKTRTFYFGKIE